MSISLERKLSELREEIIEKKQKEVSITVTELELTQIIMGLKMSNAFDGVIDDELRVIRDRKNKVL